MRWSALLLVPLFVVACDREPVAPDAVDGPLFGSAWTDWVDVVYEGENWGPVPCLEGNPEAVAVGQGFVSIHYVVTPDGYVHERWINNRFSDDFRLEIAGEAWTLKNYTRSGVNLYNPDGIQVGSLGGEANAMFENQVTGVVLNWPWRWHFSFNANGDLTVAFVRSPCRVSH